MPSPITSIAGDAELSTLLRVSSENSREIHDRTVHELLTRHPRHYLDHLRSELRAIARGESQLDMTPKEIFHDDITGGDFRVMPCVVRRPGTITKTVKIVGTNVVQRQLPDQITVGKALVLDPEENFVTHIVDACLLSSARTGACAALALELLAPRRDALILVGAGRVGFYALHYALALGGVGEVTIIDRDTERADALAHYCGRTYPGCRFTAVADNHQPRADAVILATTSTMPVCAPPAWGASLVISLGADTDYQRELDPAWAGHADIFVDTRDSARYGDLRAWLATGLVSLDNLRDLFDVLTQGAIGERPRVFVSTGSALFDNLTIAYLLDSISQP